MEAAAAPLLLAKAVHDIEKASWEQAVVGAHAIAKLTGGGASHQAGGAKHGVRFARTSLSVAAYVDGVSIEKGVDTLGYEFIVEGLLVVLWRYDVLRVGPDLGVAAAPATTIPDANTTARRVQRGATGRS